MVSVAMYEAVNRQLKKNQEYSTRNAKHDYLLRGLCWCAACGQKLRGHFNNGVRAYECMALHPSSTLTPTERCPVRHSHNANRLEKAIWTWAERFLTDPARLTNLIEAADAGSDREQARDKAELHILEQSRTKTERAVDRLLDLYVEGTLPKSKYDTKLSELKAKLSQLTCKSKEVLDRMFMRTVFAGTVYSIQQLCREMRTVISNVTPEEKRRMLEALNLRLRVCPDSVDIEGIVTDRVSLISPAPTHATDYATRFRDILLRTQYQHPSKRASARWE